MEQDRLKRAWLIGELELFTLIFILLFILALKDVIKLSNNHTINVYLHLKIALHDHIFVKIELPWSKLSP